MSEALPDELAADVVEVDKGNCVPLEVVCPELENEVTEEPVDEPAVDVKDERLVVEGIEEDDVVEDSEDVSEAVVVDEEEEEEEEEKEEDELDVSDCVEVVEVVEVVDTALVGDEVDKVKSD